MPYPSSYDLLIYAIVSASLLAIVLPHLKGSSRAVREVYPAIGQTRVKETKPGASAWFSVVVLMIVCIVSAFNIFLAPILGLLNGFEKIQFSLTVFLWAITSCATLLGGIAVIRWATFLTR